MKRQCFVTTLQAIALAWLLLLTGSSHSIVLLAEELLVPHILSDSKPNICDYTTTWKEFILTIDLGKTIAKTDSLFSVDLILMYNPDSVLFDGVWTAETLAEVVEPKYVYVRATTGRVAGYDEYNIQFGSQYGMFGRSAMIQVSGRYLAPDISCTDIVILGCFLNSDFKLPYDKWVTDTFALCATNVYDAKKTISVHTLEHSNEDTIRINEMDAIIAVPFSVRVADMKNLSSFDVEFEMNTADLEFVEESGMSSCSNYLIERTPSGYKLSVTLLEAEAVECDGQAVFDWFEIKMRRKHSSESFHNLRYTVTNIQQNACSMNGLSGDMLVFCPNIVGIAEEAGKSSVSVSQAGDKIAIRSVKPILGYEIYNVFGELIKSDNYGVYSELRDIELDRYGFNSGLYLLRIELGGGFVASFYPIKMIIN